VTGLSDPVTITFSIVGAFVFLGLLVIARLLLRREPSPWHWHRFRVGIFLERDAYDPEEVEEEPPPLGKPFDEPRP